MANFTIEGKEFKNPTSFKKERYKVTNLDRLANADMVGDLIAKKRKFYFTYSSISSVELDRILELIWDLDEVFFTLGYLENSIAKTAIVYVGAIPAELHRGTDSSAEWIWKGVTFNLIQK